MRGLIFSLAVAAATFVAVPHATLAQQYPYSYKWCAGSFAEPTSNCGFHTYAQCMATAEGFFGTIQCRPNPYYTGRQGRRR